MPEENDPRRLAGTFTPTAPWGQVNVACQTFVPMGQPPTPPGHFSCTVSRERPASTVTHAPSKRTPLPLASFMPVNVTLVVTGASGLIAAPTTGVVISPLAATIFPACPISCCRSSVVARTLVCISVRFVMVPWVFIIWTIPDKTTAETARRTTRATIVSSSVKPTCFLCIMGIHSFSISLHNPGQKGLDFKQLTTEVGRAPARPIPKRTWVRTDILIRFGATCVICQTRMYCQLAPATTGLPFRSTWSEYPGTGAFGSNPPPTCRPHPGGQAAPTTAGNCVVSVS